MKKLVEVVLAPNASGILFNLKEPGSGESGMRLSTNGAVEIIKEVIKKSSYSELMNGKESEGYIVYMSKIEYEELKKQNKID